MGTVTVVENGDGEERTIITDSQGTTVYDEDGEVITSAGGDRHDEYVESYGEGDRGNVVNETVEVPDDEIANHIPGPDDDDDKSGVTKSDDDSKSDDDDTSRNDDTGGNNDSEQ
jgi:hypothetical protein